MARLIAVSRPTIEGLETAEDLIVYAARVSNPVTQESLADPERLLRYCIRNKHWSVFETATMTIEIRTTRAIASQILRHRSFTFQEFSQRYAVVEDGPDIQHARNPHPTNRQASLDDLPEDVQRWWESEQTKVYDASLAAYTAALEKGIAKECARFVLPLATPTTLFMTGNVRDWIHYIELRTSNGTQKEHADIARLVQGIFARTFPHIATSLGWTAIAE